MVKEPNPVHNDDRPLCDFLDRLREIFAAMDREYKRAAEQYQFQCDGCTDNCCLTRFYHHTYVEYHYLRRGFKELDPRKKCEVLAKAEDVCRATADADAKRLPIRLMCPLNTDSLCDLYPYRPMICRLHGVPHELQRVGQGILNSPGCGTFALKCHGKPQFKFDRTPFYTQMAALEKEMKQAVGMTQKIKMTVAQMIVTFGDG